MASVWFRWLEHLGRYDGEVAMPRETLETTVAADGSLVLSAEELERVGAHAGDRVRVEPLPRRRIRSMRGYAARPVGFTNAHLRELRREMGEGVGDDLTS